MVCLLPSVCRWLGRWLSRSSPTRAWRTADTEGSELPRGVWVDEVDDHTTVTDVMYYVKCTSVRGPRGAAHKVSLFWSHPIIDHQAPTPWQAQ
eukprot:794795-Pyramimonas_sp.AAC.1